MVPMGAKGTVGILNPFEGFKHFSLRREPPTEDLALFVEGFWSVHWELEGRPAFEQEILPYPCVNLSTGVSGFEVHGPATSRFVAQLSGRGSVFGARFAPAGFSAFARLPMRELVDCVVSAQGAIGRAPCTLTNADLATFRAEVEKFLRSFQPLHTEQMALADRLVRLAQEDRSIARAEDLASAAGTSVRSLHRLFERHVGVGPKWVVRRSRVQEAAERVARGEAVDWAATAQDLGYHDQAHLIRDFRDQIGLTPAAYARRCEAAVAERGRVAASG
jgi:methylphosphotriester-DNA--protein-cysteine methyltransferase